MLRVLYWIPFSSFTPQAAARRSRFLASLGEGRKVGFPSRTGEGQTLGGLPGFAYATVSQDWTFFVQPKLRSSRARGNGLSFPGPPRLCTRRLPAWRCARDTIKGPWEEPMKSQGRASEPAQAKIGTLRPFWRAARKRESRGDGWLASQAHREADYIRPGGDNSCFLFLFQFPGVNVGSADGGSGVNIQPKASWESAIAKHFGHHSSSYVWLAYNLRAS